MNLGLQSLLAQNASRQLNIAGNDKQKTTEQLSSGYRINTAADDAAGLSISEKMRKQILGLKKAAQNINDGISYVQVADGALSEVQTMLHRMSELSIQAANDTYTDSDRLAIDTEVQQLKTEIDRIFEETEFNAKKIWDTNTNDKVQIGTTPEPAVTVTTNYYTNYSIKENNKWAVAYGSYSISANEDGYSVSWIGYNGANYSTKTFEWPEDWFDDDGLLNTTNLTFHITADSLLSDGLTDVQIADAEGIDFSFKYKVSQYATLSDVIASINGTTASSSPSGSVYPKLSAKDGFSLSYTNPNTGATVSVSALSASMTYSALLASDRTFGIADDTFIDPSVTANFSFDNATDKWCADFKLGTGGTHPLASQFTGTATSASTYYSASTLETYGIWWQTIVPTNGGSPYNVLINHYPVPSDGSLTSCGQSMGNVTNTNTLASTTFGGNIYVTFKLNGSYSIPVASYNDSQFGSVLLRLNVSPDTSQDDIKQVMSQINTLDLYSNASYGSHAIYKPNLASDITVDAPVYEAQLLLNIQTSDIAYDHINIAYSSLRTLNLGISGTNTLTSNDSQSAISEIAKALDIVSAQRSLFGAYQNQLESAHSVTQNSGENVQASESRLRDADLGDVIVAFSAYDIIQRAGESMLAQANSNLKNVLSLLQY